MAEATASTATTNDAVNASAQPVLDPGVELREKCLAQRDALYRR